MYPAVYIGTGRSADRIAELFGDRVAVVSDVSAAFRMLGSRKDEHGFIFYEKGDPKIDAQSIRFLRSWFTSFGIILLIESGLHDDERGDYLRAGVNAALRNDTDEATFRNTLRFMTEHTFCYRPVVQDEDCGVSLFHIPLWKRVFDIVASGAAILVLSPVLLLIAAAIRIDSRGPVIYRSKRVGSNYRIFDFLKFRSMRIDADGELKEYSELNQYASEPKKSDVSEPKKTIETGNISLSDEEIAQIIKDMENGMLLSDDCLVAEKAYQNEVTTEQENAFVKIENDPRITKLGRFLRKYSIDELPQLFNILRGDMSVVGNRPLPLYEAENLTSDEYSERFMCPSGLTGLWQVEKRGGRGKMSPEERKYLDIRYAREMSPWLDLKIILRTFTAFIQKEDV